MNFSPRASHGAGARELPRKRFPSTPAIRWTSPATTSELPGKQRRCSTRRRWCCMRTRQTKRAKRARATVNSLWLWFGPGDSRALRVAVGRRGRSRVDRRRPAGRRRPSRAAAPRRATGSSACLTTAGTLALLDALRKQPENAVLDELERDWFAPLLAAASRRAHADGHAARAGRRRSAELRGDPGICAASGGCPNDRALRMRIVGGLIAKASRRALLDAGMHPCWLASMPAATFAPQAELNTGWTD